MYGKSPIHQAIAQNDYENALEPVRDLKDMIKSE